MQYKFTRLYLIILLFNFFGQPAFAQMKQPGTPIAPVALNQPHPEKSLQFIQNKNQWDKSVAFMAQLPGGRLFLQNKSLVYTFFEESQLAHAHNNPNAATAQKATEKIKAHAYKVNFVGAGTGNNKVNGQQPSEAVRNYYIGKDPSRWAAGVKAFAQVTYEALYPGINMHLYEQDAHLKYEFLLEPQANPTQIKMQYQGADKIFIQNNELHIKTSVTEVVEQKPYAYQLQNNQPVEVPCFFKLDGDVVTFEFPAGYDRSKPLVIDPVLVFSTYTGSRADNWGFTATYDEEGNMYSGGIVAGFGFPATMGAYNIDWGGNPDGGSGTGWDIGILKYKTNPAGASSLLYATYLGGRRSDVPNSLVVNSKNELLILGVTGSDDYPTTAGAHDQSFNGGSPNIVPLSGIQFNQGTDLLISRLRSNGSALLASTYLGGTSDDGILSNSTARNPLDKNYGDQFRGDIFTDATDQVYIVSSTRSNNFPVVNGFQSAYGGGSNDGVVAKLTPALAVQWSSFVGGNGADAAYSVQLDKNSNIFICGGTTSADLPGTNGAFLSGYRGGQADGFVAKINNNGSALQRVSYLGTSAYDQTYFVQLDGEDNVYLLGQTLGSYPTSAGVYANRDGRQFIHKLNNDLTGSLLSTTFGSGNSAQVNISPTAFLVDNCNRIYVAGWGGGANANQPYSNGTTTGLPVSNDGHQRTTDGSDFYLMLLSRDASALEYATFFGAEQTGIQSGEHVDGGTSRFDKRGFVYQAVCAGCGGSQAFPTTPNAWSRSNNALNCNNGSFKFDFNIVVAEAGPDQEICANAPPFQLSGFTPATGGTWSGPGVSANGTFTPSANLVGPQILTYTVANGSCISTSTKIITVMPLPVVSFTGLSPSICLPHTAVTLVGSPAGGTFSGPGMSSNIFTPATAGTGTHTITYSFTNEKGCTVTSSRQVVISEMPAVTAGPDERICSGSFPIMLSGFAPAGGTWSGTGVSANGLFTPSEALVGTHVLTYTITNGSCTVAQTKTVVVDPTVKFTQGPDLIICPDATAFAVTDIIPPGGTWSGSGVSSDGIFTPAPGMNGPQPLTYFVTVGACSGISSKNVTVSALPVVQAAAVPTECGTATQLQGFAPFTASFTNTTTGATGYLWDFGDGSTSTETLPTHQYANEGNYEVTLTVFFGNNCRLQRPIASVQVEKKQLVPNVFTPNNDGLNDTFIPRITCLPTDLKIFNRWGKQVYEQKNYQNNWGGEGLTDGIYYYQLTSTKGQIWKGWVEIIR
ncbi:DUF7948 domain-containing protein [Adhaeribacter rhizoryzae]|uniref:T9SS type B sorting domain-containing protein n=1 Tax=Adhaeribacter rhizoryzae TaxID=2607907 RepID=A0A5M6DBY8_9BACT|nr:gliding motility-associated C-terminal domain-containing protein [Adhaeribacter rhizoryzae]KAA5545057.1 T9SS type B sorting domain-containing protein [Adhaeribacter rhizoryzae]